MSAVRSSNAGSNKQNTKPQPQTCLGIDDRAFDSLCIDLQENFKNCKSKAMDLIKACSKD